MSKLSTIFNQNRFAVISWAVTLALVAGMIGGAVKWRQDSSVQALAPIATAKPDSNLPSVEMQTLANVSDGFRAIPRKIELKTNVPADKPRYKVEEYRVKRGDSVFAIAESFKIK